MDTLPIYQTPPPLVPARHDRHITLIVLIAATAFFLLATIFLFLRNPGTPQSSSSQLAQKAIISGSFDINGVVPLDAVIVINRTNVSSSTDSQQVPQSFAAVDQGSWSLSDIASGKTYQVVASVVAQGKTIATSDPIEVTAPAEEETIILNIPTKTPSGSAVISGNIRVDGYIPQGATIMVEGRNLGKTKYTTIASNLPGSQSQFMSYASAIAGQTYEVMGTLMDSNGNQIGTSDMIVVTAPAFNEVLTINSHAVPPATPTPAPTLVPTKAPSTATATQIPPVTPTPTPTPIMISGNIDFNGVAPANSRIVILEKVYNQQQYQVAVDNVTPLDNTSWQWTGATVGTWYNIVAVLKQRQSDGTDQDIATSQAQSIAAPGANVTLTINSGIVLSPPPGPITVSCGSLSGSTWGAQMSVASVAGGQTYWLEVGTSSGANNIYNSIQNTNNQSNQTANMNLNNGTTYYARYAYATTLNATQPQFSPFSATTQFQCSQ